MLKFALTVAIVTLAVVPARAEGGGGDATQILNRFFISFLVILIPFIIINALLSGTLIPDEVVWYDSATILEIRIFTIPVEDISYAFCLILLNLLLINRFQKAYESK